MSSAGVDGADLAITVEKEVVIRRVSERDKLESDSTATAVNSLQTKLHLKPQYLFDANASVNVEDSPMTKDLTARFDNLSLKQEAPPKLDYSKDIAEDVSWLPTILRDQWSEDLGEDHNRETESGYVDTNNYDSSTYNDESVIIHDEANNALKTEERIPEWKRAAIDAKERKSKIQPKLKEYFEPLEENESAKLEVPANEKDQQQSTIDSSTFNTAFKLFGQHDSFTSNKLNQIIVNLQNSNLQDKKQLVELIKEETEAPSPQISDNSEAIDATANKTEDYIKNANALFANLKMKGAPVVPKLPHDWQNQNITSTTTVSSSSLDDSWEFRDDDVQAMKPSPLLYQRSDENPTNVDLSVTDSASESSFRGDEYLSEENPSIEGDTREYIKEDDVPQAYNTTFPHLQPENKIITPKVKNIIYHKPTLIKPEDFEMKFDSKRNEWMPAKQQLYSEEHENDENVLALDAIHDLTTNSRKNAEQVQFSIKHGAEGSVLTPKDLNSRAEVSFKLPLEKYSTSNSRNSSVSNSHARNHSGSDIDATNVSQIHDISFSESKRKLVNVLTTIQPDGDWDDLVELELLDMSISNLNDFEKIVPNLKRVNLSRNGIHFLEGLPRNIKDIIVCGNLLDNLTSFAKFKNLRHLDISDNMFEKLSALSSLENLTTLRASNNNIQSLSGISKLESLAVLDLSGNKIEGTLDFIKFNLSKLQKLDLSENKITKLLGVQALPDLVDLKVDENMIEQFDSAEPHKKLKKLSLKMNNLKELHCEKFSHLRILRIDGNELATVTGLQKLRYLDELSAKAINNDHVLSEIEKYIYDTRKLDLSGVVKFDFSKLAIFSNLNTLVLCALNLEKLPSNFSRLFVNVRELNLNFNKLLDISQLAALKKLRSLYLVSNALNDLEHLLNALAGSRNTLKKLDIRLNPLNKGFYSFVFSPHETDASHSKLDQDDIPDSSLIQLDTADDIQSFSVHFNYLLKHVTDEESDWASRDKAHIKALKLNHSKKDGASFQSLYKRRLSYEALVLRLCSRLGYFDGKIIGKDDMIDAKIRLQEILD